MCTPTLMIASTVLSAFGQIQQASAASSAAKANASIASTNAKIKDQAAQDALQRGADAAGDEREKAKRANALLRARAAGSGVTVDTGTNLDLQAQNAGTGELNALIVTNNAEREAYGYKVGAMNDNMQAASFRQQARSAWNTGLLSTAGTLVTGAYNYGNAYNRGVSLPWQRFGNVRPSYMGGGYYGF